MPQKDLVSTIKSLLGYEVEESIVRSYINISKSKILNRLYPYSNESNLEVPSKYEYKIIEITIYFINKMGAEGQKQHTENGITRIYENADIPQSMLRDITPFVGVIK